ncbi:MAG: group II intron reverse transcriptase/maturase [Anaeromyxobacter sp. RBG_16_69_14]|nr:MAG: group II intron reverse transcriptase/maturase [Anaeromyxobacter sp. RBG_16_69_14]
MRGSSSPISVSTKLQQIAELARQSPSMVLTTLAHHIDVGFLQEAYRRTRKDGAPGVDRQTANQYAEELDSNLCSLLDRLKSGTYQAPPVKRVHIPKGDGSKTRPIGIPTFEDKILQRAVTMVLEAVYEQEFHECSYGFRPGRSAHQALQALWRALTEMGGGWVYEVDIKGFFDSLVPEHLRSFLDQRVRDGVLRRSIDKWLKAGVMEDGAVSFPDFGTPQGGVVSPLLANVYLHEVLDKWFEKQVRPRLAGRAVLIRYADDFVIAFSRESDARRVMGVMPKRFGRYGLTLHPEKTRLVRFHRPSSSGGYQRGSRPGTFDLLGFTHYWGRSYRGFPVIKCRTVKGRLSRALVAVALWCRTHRHLPVGEQQRILNLKLRGHYSYYGITGNFRALKRFASGAKATWRKWLNCRSQRARMNWERFTRLLKRYPLLPPRVVQSVYAQRTR